MIMYSNEQWIIILRFVKDYILLKITVVNDSLGNLKGDLNVKMSINWNNNVPIYKNINNIG